MDPRQLRDLLERVAAREIGIDEAQSRLAELPFSDLGFAKLDLHRELRSGLPEAVFGEGKTLDELIPIVGRLLDAHQAALATRLSDSPLACSRLDAAPSSSIKPCANRPFCTTAKFSP